MLMLELDAKRAAGQITEEQFRESMDILTGPGLLGLPPPAPRPRRR